MKTPNWKCPRIRLNSQEYSGLRRLVLKRDSWRCQICGSMRHLQVHHIKFRSLRGNDSERNLITLCAKCHAQIHQGRVLAASTYNAAHFNETIELL